MHAWCAAGQGLSRRCPVEAAVRTDTAVHLQARGSTAGWVSAHRTARCMGYTGPLVPVTPGN